MHMLAPYPPTLRPTLYTIRKHLWLQEDLPESVQRPEFSLRETMRMVKQRHPQPALRKSRVPLPGPVATPVSPHLQPNLVESHSKPKRNGLHRQIGLENPTTRQPDPLEMVGRGRAPPPHDPTIPGREVHGHPKRQPGRYTSTQGPTNAEREVPRLPTLQPAARIMHGGPSTTPQGPTIGERRVLRPPKLQPAAHISQGGRYQTPESPTIIERQNLGPSMLQPATQDNMPAVAQQEPDQRPSTQAVDFSQGAIEPKNPFTEERLEAEINRRVEVRLTEERRIKEGLRLKQKESRHKKPANRDRNGPIPGEWRSDSTLPGSDNVSRTSQLSTAASGYNHDSQSSLASSELYSSRPVRDISRKTSGRPNGGAPRSEKNRVNTHARHNERASRLETVPLQRRMLNGLMLTLNYGAYGIFNMERVVTYLPSGVHGLYSTDVQIYSFAWYGIQEEEMAE